MAFKCLSASRLISRRHEGLATAYGCLPVRGSTYVRGLANRSRARRRAGGSELSPASGCGSCADLSGLSAFVKPPIFTKSSCFISAAGHSSR